MPLAVGRVPDSRYRTGLAGGRPLHIRFQEALQTAARGIPESDTTARQCLTLMESEFNLDLIYRQIEASKVRRAPREPDAATRAADSELYQLKLEFNRCVLEIRNSQIFLERARSDWRHQILGIHPDAFTPAPGLFATAVGEGPDFANAIEARTAVSEMHKRLSWIRGICAHINECKSFEVQPKELQAFTLLRALVARFTDFETRIEALEARAMAAAARLDRLERHLKPKNSKSRSTPSKRSTNTGTKT